MEVSSPSKTLLDWVSKEALGLKGLLVLRQEKELKHKTRDKKSNVVVVVWKIFEKFCVWRRNARQPR